MKLRHYLINGPDREYLCIGGELVESQRPGHVWVRSPAGQNIFEVARKDIQLITRERMAEILLQEQLSREGN